MGANIFQIIRGIAILSKCHITFICQVEGVWRGIKCSNAGEFSHITDNDLENLWKQIK